MRAEAPKYGYFLWVHNLGTISGQNSRGFDIYILNGLYVVFITYKQYLKK